MLLPEQIIPFLLHDDPIVREHAVRYFRDSYDFGPLTAEHYWAGIDRLGETDAALGFASELSRLPQTDASLHRVVQALAANPSELFEFHYQHVARDMEMSVLVRNREELLGCQQLLPHVRKHLELRLGLLHEPAESAWDRLMRHGRDLGEEYADKFEPSLSDALIEAAARVERRFASRRCLRSLMKRRLRIGAKSLPSRSLGERGMSRRSAHWWTSWRSTPMFCAKKSIAALPRIGTPQVIQRIVDFYPGKPWHVRQYAHSSIGNIKRPESVDALLILLGVEMALAAKPDVDDDGEPLIDSLLFDLTRLGSLAGLDESRRRIADFPEDPEVLGVCEGLVATAVMTGATLPEEAEWRALIKRRNERIEARTRNIDAMFARMRDDWRKTGMSFPPSKEKTDELEWRSRMALQSNYGERQQPIRNTAPKVGRNDPCPCGSGKKYKKCCGK